VFAEAEQVEVPWAGWVHPLWTMPEATKRVGTTTSPKAPVYVVDIAIVYMVLAESATFHATAVRSPSCALITGTKEELQEFAPIAAALKFPWKRVQYMEEAASPVSVSKIPVMSKLPPAGCSQVTVPSDWAVVAGVQVTFTVPL